MDSAVLIHLFNMAAVVTLKLAAPALIVTLVIGLIVSLFQALTQVNESTLAFVPKVAALGIIGWLALPWAVQEMVGFMVQVLEMVGGVSR